MFSEFAESNIKYIQKLNKLLTIFAIIERFNVGKKSVLRNTLNKTVEASFENILYLEKFVEAFNISCYQN